MLGTGHSHIRKVIPVQVTLWMCLQYYYAAMQYITYT